MLNCTTMAKWWATISANIVMTVVEALTFVSVMSFIKQLNITAKKKVKTIMISFVMSLLLSLSCGVNGSILLTTK